ncbi:MAG: DMT family transporter [Thermoplasmata archaeon]|nr:DMT family transporter [Thermoplasmata archaeon]
MKKSELAIMVAVVSVSFSAILIRWSSAPALAIAFWRLFFTTLFLLPFFILWKRDELKNLGWKRMGGTILIGAVLAMHFSLWVKSLEMTTVASSVILVTAHPILVAGMSYYLWKEPLSKANVAGIIIAIVGVIILSYGDLGAGNIWGNILAYIAGVCAGLYILAGRKMRRDISLLTYAFLVYMWCFVFLFILCLATSTLLYPYPASDFYLFILMAAVPGILGHTLYNWSLKHVRASVVSVSLLGEPIGSTLLAFVLLGEAPASVLVIIGGGFTLVGIVMAARKVRKRRKKGNWKPTC